MMAQTMENIFNNKMKVVLLILIWTLIWRRHGCVVAVGFMNNNRNNTDSDKNNKSIKVQIDEASNGYGDISVDVVADEDDGAARYNAKGLQKYKQQDVQVTKDQLIGINKTLNCKSSTTSGNSSSNITAELQKNNNNQNASQHAVVVADAITDYDELLTKTIATTKTIMAKQTKMMFKSNTAAAAVVAATINDAVVVHNAYNENDTWNGVKNSSSYTNVNDNVAPVHLNNGMTMQVEEHQNASKVKGEEEAEAIVEEVDEDLVATAEDDEQQQSLDMTVALQQQLIYEFAMKYKHISRVTYLTCRMQQTMATDNNNKNPEESNDQRQQQQINSNMNTMEILKRMFILNIVETATTTKTVTTSTPTTKTTTIATAVPLPQTSEKKNGKGNGTGSVDIAETTSAVAPSTPPPTIASIVIAKKRSTQQKLHSKGILIKVVQIDQLINKRRNTNNNMLRRSKGPGVATAAAYGRGGVVGGGGSGATGAGRNSYTNANWLEQVLRSETLRQIVVLNLSCGAASRRLLEMASNKALFNSSYHWLLIEDYALNRQTEIDDNDENNNYNKARNNKEVVNNDEQTLKTQDIVGAAAGDGDGGGGGGVQTSSTLTDTNEEQRGRQQQQQHPRSSIAASTVAAAAAAAGASVADSSTTSTIGNEDDMEIIEKFLEKINININTELILAKRMQRRSRKKSDERLRNNVDVDVLDADDDVDVRFGNNNTDNQSNNNNNHSNNSLQKKDYYKLYDVWNPGLQYGGQLNISEIGYFTLDDGFQIAPWYQRSTTITRRMDMKMARIRCLIVSTNKNRTDTLEHYLTTHYDTHMDSMNRFNFALLLNVRDLFNFSFVLSKTSTWGYLKNGKFDGMIGALVRKQADIGGSPIFFRIERAKVIDYTSRTWVARPCFIFRHPRSTKKDRIVFLQPFSNPVWISLGVCGILTILLLWLLSTLERKLESQYKFSFVTKVTNSAATLLRGTSSTAVSPAAAAASIAVAGSEDSTVNLFNNNSTIAATEDEDADMNAGAAAATHSMRTTFTTLGSQHRTDVNVFGVGSTTTNGGGVRGLKRFFIRCGLSLCGQSNIQDDVAQNRAGLFLESVLFYIGSICQQGLSFSTSFFSGRCIVVTSLLFAFSIYQFYSASIVGTLLMEKPKTIRSLRDLIHSSLEIGIEDIVYNRDFFLRTKDPDAIELYAKKVTSIPMNDDSFAETPGDGSNAAAAGPTSAAGADAALSAAAKAKSYREILHSHETGAHAKTNEASNWYDPEFGIAKIKKGRFAFHVDVATAYKIIADTFNEKEICDLTEIQLFPPQKMVSIVQKGSPLRKIMTYGLRRITEVGLMDYQRKIWHSPKPRCVKQIHTDDLRVDMQTFASALLVLIFGYAFSLLALGFEIMHHKLCQHYAVI